MAHTVRPGGSGQPPRNDDLAVQIDNASSRSGLVHLVEAMSFPVMRVAYDGTVLFANEASGVLLRESDLSIGQLVPEEWIATIKAVGNGGTKRTIDWEGFPRRYQMTFVSERDAGWVDVFAIDVTRYIEAEERAEFAVSHDSLTGLPNRALFADRLEQVIALARRNGNMAAVHIIGLDGFKEINDTEGHTTGDAILQIVASRLSRATRTSDTAARLGGDEFAVIQIELAGEYGVNVFARKLQSVLAEPMEFGGRTVACSAGIGISIFPGEVGSGEDLVRNAQIALDHCKNEGGGGYRFFINEMHEEIKRRRAVEAELARALDNQELVLHFQPKVNLTTGKVTGMEALVRWIHPVNGFMSPVEFIPVAERSRLIIPLGEWVLRESCERTKAWNDAGLGPLKVAVNLSGVQFHAPSLVDGIRTVLDQSGLPPNCLELEITETVAMEDAESTSEVFKRLAELGVSLSIDDFGTGYSSLAYLKRFPIDRIKIDKTFVDDIGGEANAGAIARAVTTLGHSFGMEVTAEGVETTDQVSFLRRLECDEIQGYLFSKPLPRDEFEAFVREYKPALKIEPAIPNWSAFRGKRRARV